MGKENKNKHDGTDPVLEILNGIDLTPTPFNPDDYTDTTLEKFNDAILQRIDEVNQKKKPN